MGDVRFTPITLLRPIGADLIFMEADCMLGVEHTAAVLACLPSQPAFLRAVHFAILEFEIRDTAVVHARHEPART